MSGQLVGEVLEARAGQLADLSQAETLALVAIAEKCHADSRQGSVRMSYIEAAIGKSRRTAVRALAQLRQRQLIRVVKRGYKSHGVARASIYELSVLVPSRAAQAPVLGCAIQAGASGDLPLVPNPDVLVPIPDVLVPSLDGTLDGSIDGSLDGCARTAVGELESSGPPSVQPTIRSAYTGTLSIACSNCGAQPENWCTTPDGRVRRVPCVDRIATASLAPVIRLPPRVRSHEGEVPREGPARNNPGHKTIRRHDEHPGQRADIRQPTHR